MNDNQDKNAKDTRDSRTINIEIPTNGFEGMFRMMTGRRDSGQSRSRCCETAQSRCRPQAGEDEKQEFKIVIKRKE